MDETLKAAREVPAYKFQVDTMVDELKKFYTMIKDSIEFNLGASDQPRYTYNLRLKNLFIPVGSNFHSPNVADIAPRTEYFFKLVEHVPEISSLHQGFIEFCDREGLKLRIEDNDAGLASCCPDTIFTHIEFIISEITDDDDETEAMVFKNKTVSFGDRLYYLIFGNYK